MTMKPLAVGELPEKLSYTSSTNKNVTGRVRREDAAEME